MKRDQAFQGRKDDDLFSLNRSGLKLIIKQMIEDEELPARIGTEIELDFRLTALPRVGSDGLSFLQVKVQGFGHFLKAVASSR